MAGKFGSKGIHHLEVLRSILASIKINIDDNIEDAIRVIQGPLYICRANKENGKYTLYQEEVEIPRLFIGRIGSTKIKDFKFFDVGGLKCDSETYFMQFHRILADKSADQATQLFNARTAKDPVDELIFAKDITVRKLKIVIDIVVLVARRYSVRVSKYRSGRKPKSKNLA